MSPHGEWAHVGDEADSVEPSLWREAPWLFSGNGEAAKKGNDPFDMQGQLPSGPQRAER